MTVTHAPLKQPTATSHVLQTKRAIWLSFIVSPAMIVFIATNLANVGNLGFNMVFGRLLGPDRFGQLAIVLTVMLAFLCLFTSLQMASSQLISRQTGAAREHTVLAIMRLSKHLFWAAWLFVPLGIWAAIANPLNLDTPMALTILVLILPVAAPLSLARGRISGEIDVLRIVASAHIEVLVRFVGALIAWYFGFGLQGIAVALTASVIVGWAAAHKPYKGRSFDKSSPAMGKTVKALITLSLPFAALQISQIILMDGDVFFANAFMNKTQTGLIASLSLVQRIQFFACFGMSIILLPSVSNAVTQGENPLTEAYPVLLIFLSVSLMSLAATFLFPKTIITLLMGQSYSQASSSVFLASLSATIFTACYLLATYLFALSDKICAMLFPLFILIQIVSLQVKSHFSHGFEINEFMAIKAAFLGALFVILFIRTLQLTHKQRTSHA